MDFTKIATEFGVSVALLCMLIYTLYRSGVWLANNVVKPLAERHLMFVERIEKVQMDQALTLQEIARTQEKQTQIQRDEIVQLKVLESVAQKTLENLIARDTLVQTMKADLAEIAKRLPSADPANTTDAT